MSTTPDPDAVASLARELIASFYGTQDQELSSRTQVHGKRTDPGLPPTVWALVAHAHHLATPALDLLEAGLDLAGAPLVRGIYEAAITAQWVINIPSAVEGINHEHLRQLSNLMKKVDGAGWFGGTPVTGLTGPEKAMLNARPAVTSRNFEQICNDLLPGGDQAYLLYKALSSQTHVGAHVLNRYLSVAPSGDRLAVHIHPQPEEGASWIYLLATSLVWAGGALDWIDTTQSRKRQLDAAGKTLQIARNLAPHPQAWVRETRNQRASRHRLRGRAANAPMGPEPHDA